MSNYVPPVDPLSETDKNSSLINQIAQVKNAIQDLKNARLQENPSQSNKAQAPAQTSTQFGAKASAQTSTQFAAKAPAQPTHAFISDAEATKLNAKISTSSAYSANANAFISVPIPQTSNAAPILNASVVNAIYEIPLLIGKLSLKIAAEMLATIAASLQANIAVTNNIAATEADLAEISLALGKAAKEIQFQAAKKQAIANAKAQGDANTTTAGLGYGLGSGLGGIAAGLALWGLWVAYSAFTVATWGAGAALLPLVLAATAALVSVAAVVVGTFLAVNSDRKAAASYALADSLSTAKSMSDISRITQSGSDQMNYGFLGKQGESDLANVSLALDIASIVLTLGAAAAAVAASRGILPALKTFTVFAKDTSAIVKAVTFTARVAGAAGQLAGLVDDITRVGATIDEMINKQPNAFKNGLIAPGLTAALEKSIGKDAAEKVSISVSVLVQVIQMGMSAKQLRKAGNADDAEIVKQDDSASDGDAKVDGAGGAKKSGTGSDGPVGGTFSSRNLGSTSGSARRQETKARTTEHILKQEVELSAAEGDLTAAKTLAGEANTKAYKEKELAKKDKMDEAEAKKAKEDSVEEVRVATNTVKEAQTKVAAAQEKVNKSNTPENNEELKQAQGELESAKQTLSNAETNNEVTSKKLKDAEQKAEASKAAAEEAEAKADKSQEKVKTAQTLLDHVLSAKIKSDAAQGKLDKLFYSKITESDGAQTKLLKTAQEKVVIATETVDAAKVKLTKAEVDADIAMVKLNKAQSELDSIKNATNATKLKEDAIAKRDMALKDKIAAEEDLAKARVEYDASNDKLKISQNELNSAKASREETNAELMDYRARTDKSKVEAAQEQLTKAKESRLEATQAEVEFAKGKLSTSEAKLKEANKRLSYAEDKLVQLKKNKAPNASIEEARLQRDTAKMEQTAANRNKLIADAKVTASTKRQDLAIADKKANDLNIKAKNDEANAAEMTKKATTDSEKTIARNEQTKAKESRRVADAALEKVNSQKLKNINKDLDKLVKTDHGKAMSGYAELIVEADTHKTSDWKTYLSPKKDSNGVKLPFENAKKTVEIDAPMKDKNGRVMRDADGIMMTEKKQVAIEKLDDHGNKMYVQRKEVARLNMIFSIFTANLMVYNGGKMINAAIQQNTFQMIKAYTAQMNAEITKNTKLAENARAALGALNKLNSAQHNKLMAFLTQTMKIIAEIENSVLNTQQR